MNECTNDDMLAYTFMVATSDAQNKHQDQKRVANVQITGFLLSGQPQGPGKNRVLEQPIWATERLQLSHQDRYFTFQFSSFNYRENSGDALEFMLKGYDPGWRKATGEPSVTYLNVRPGSYTFRVRDNRLGNSANEASILVVVHPPWWRSWWAYSLYFLTATGIGLLFYRFQINRRLEEAEAQRLLELDAFKTRMYTNITHEFRTPLTIILGMAQQVLDNPKDHFRPGLEMIRRNGQDLLSLVNEMLDLTRLDHGNIRLAYQHGDVVPLLKYLLESFHSLARQKDIQLHFRSETPVFAMDFDAERLQQVVGNLLSNALKFTPEGGQVRLFVNPLEAGGKLQISVQDNRVGIPKNEQSQIFERFYQVSVDNEELPLSGEGNFPEGVGIGLALCRELVKLMGGDIELKSETGKGSVFTITLPARSKAAAQRSVSPPENDLAPAEVIVAPAIPSAGRSNIPLVLLIEDNPDVITYLSGCLRQHYQIKTGKDGREGLALAFQSIPDLIITDVMMPFKDGFELCRTLKNDERTSHIPIIMLTAKGDMTSKLEGLERGADDYLSKPFDRAELLIRVRKLLELRRKLQQYYLAAAGLAKEAVILEGNPEIERVEHIFVRKVRKVILDHLDDPEFTVDVLCKAILMSHSNLHRKLSALTGDSPNSFIRNIRLNKAKELLRNPALTISSIAYDTGFRDPSYFGRVFKQEFGMTPQDWREARAVE